MIKRYKRCKCQCQQCTAQHNNMVIETRPVPMIEKNGWKENKFFFYNDGRVVPNYSYK